MTNHWRCSNATLWLGLFEEKGMLSVRVFSLQRQLVKKLKTYEKQLRFLGLWVRFLVRFLKWCDKAKKQALNIFIKIILLPFPLCYLMIFFAWRNSVNGAFGEKRHVIGKSFQHITVNCKRSRKLNKKITSVSLFMSLIFSVFSKLGLV
jgi:hypothetical protein